MRRGVGMMPTRGLHMLRGLLVMAHLMVCDGFLIMTRGVSILFRRVRVLRCSLERHSRSFHERLLPARYLCMSAPRTL